MRRGVPGMKMRQIFDLRQHCTVLRTSLGWVSFLNPTYMLEKISLLLMVFQLAKVLSLMEMVKMEFTIQSSYFLKAVMRFSVLVTQPKQRLTLKMVAS